MKIVFALAGFGAAVAFLFAHAVGISASHATPPPPPMPPLVRPAPEPIFVFAKLTAYDLDEKCTGVWAFKSGPRRTAANTDAQKPGLGADFGWFPKGTIVEIPDIGKLAVDDTGDGARIDAKHGVAHFDIRIVQRPGETMEAAHERARQFAVKWMVVKVSPPNPPPED